MRTDDELREAIINAIPYLPPVFDPEQVAQAIEVSAGYVGHVRKALNALEADGQIYRLPSIRRVRGRRAARWTVDVQSSQEGLIEQEVRSVLGQMPPIFSVWDLIKAAQMPNRVAKDVVQILERWEQDSIVVRIARRKAGRPGVTNTEWSADKSVIDRERRAREEMSAQRAQAVAEIRAVFDRMSERFWEFDSDQT